MPHKSSRTRRGSGSGGYFGDPWWVGPPVQRRGKSYLATDGAPPGEEGAKRRTLKAGIAEIYGEAGYSGQTAWSSQQHA